jgi:sugar/nucleoside kinase (ribokinase family)
MTTHHHLYAIGNALVDSEYEVSDAQLQAAGVEKRHMTLIDAHRRTELLHHVQGVHARRTGGGSAGNTAVALAQLGGRAFYSCRVADDELGDFYTKDLLSHGVATNLTNTRAPQGQTGSCMVMVTPDAERSMSTFLGATADIDATCLQPMDIVKSRIYYMEGYLAASPTGLDAAIQGREVARAAGVALATTLSDMTMINFCRPGLQAMVGNTHTGVLDYLFCNEEEAQVWCGTQELASICQQLGAQARVVCLTRSAKGCVVLEGGQQNRGARRQGQGHRHQRRGGHVCRCIHVRSDSWPRPRASRMACQPVCRACGVAVWKPAQPGGHGPAQGRLCPLPGPLNV